MGKKVLETMNKKGKQTDEAWMKLKYHVDPRADEYFKEAERKQLREKNAKSRADYDQKQKGKDAQVMEARKNRCAAVEKACQKCSKGRKCVVNKMNSKCLA